MALAQERGNLTAVSSLLGQLAKLTHCYEVSKFRNNCVLSKDILQTKLAPEIAHILVDEVRKAMPGMSDDAHNRVVDNVLNRLCGAIEQATNDVPRLEYEQ